MLESRKQVHWFYRQAMRVAVLGMVFVSPAHAHKLNIFAFVESDKVLVDSYFVDGTKARDSKVRVYDPSGKVVAEGMTDKQGHYEFPVPGQADLKITVDAGMGHRAEWLVPAADLGEAQMTQMTTPVDQKKQAATAKAGSAASSPAPAQVGAESSVAATATPDQAELRRIVNQAVSEAVLPLVRSIEELKQHDSLTQVIGSIGYIFGVFGLWVFFKSRREPPVASKEKPDNDR